MQIKSLQIDVSEGRAGKGAIERLPGLIKRDLRFLRVKKEFSASIERQQSSRFAMTVSNEDSFNSDVQLLLVDGKYFYRPNGVHI
jgi:C4-type Zn-finger protein